MEMKLQMSNLTYALRTIYRGYHRTIEEGHDHYVCQLVNSHRGFNPDVIDALRERADSFSFDIPVHISILPVGASTSTDQVFDGLETIYCNSVELEQAIAEIKNQKYFR